jgi:hypothetical protein
VFVEMTSESAISLFVMPWASSSKTSRSRSVRRSSSLLVLTAARASFTV